MVPLERVDSILFPGNHGIHCHTCKPDVFYCVEAHTYLSSLLIRVLIAEQGKPLPGVHLHVVEVQRNKRRAKK